MRQEKSRSKRRVYRKTPSGRVVRLLKKRKPSKPHCADCGGVLAGVPHIRAGRLRGIAKTRKRPERSYGGVLCSACARKKLVEKARRAGTNVLPDIVNR